MNTKLQPNEDGSTLVNMLKSFALVCRTLLIWVAILLPAGLVAQVSISYPVAAQPIQKGMSSSFLTIKVDFSTTCNNVLAEIRFPPNTQYIPGSLDSMAGNMSISEQSTSNLRRPVFALSNGSSSSTITFRVRRRVLCTSLNIGKDSVYVSSSCGTTTENASNVNTYNLPQPVLSFATVPTLQNGLIGKVFTRSLQVVNGGQGCLDTFRFYIINQNRQYSYLDSVQFNQVKFAPVRSRGDTLFYTIFGATLFGGNATLCNGGRVTITETLRIDKCSGRTLYGAYWGPNDQRTCQLTTATGNISMASGVGGFTSLAVNLTSNFVDMCGSRSNGFVEFNARYHWTGNGNDTAAGAYNLQIDLGNYSNNQSLTALPSDIFSTVDSVKINGISVPSVFQNGILSIDLRNRFTSDPDGAGGLTDLDGDGFFDDLRLGTSLFFTFKVKMECQMQCNAPKNTSFSGNMRYSRMCDTTTQSSGRVNSGRSFFEINWLSNSYIPSNITPGKNFRIRLSNSASNNSNYFRNTQTRFVWELILPKGFSVAGNGNISWYNGFYYGTPAPVSRTFTQSNDTVFIMSPSTNPGWIELDLLYTCDSFFTQQFDIPFRLVQVNHLSNQCQCLGLMLCDKLTTRTYCDIGCKKGPVTGIPVVRRSVGSIGWTDYSLQTRQDRDRISTYDLSKALYLDTIEIFSDAIQQDSSRNLKLRFELPKTTSNTHKLTPLSVAYYFYRNDSLIRSGFDTTVMSMTNSTTTLQVIDWDLINLIPNGQLLPNDSIVTITRYVVSSTILPFFDVQSGGNWYYYGIDLQTYDLKYCNQRTAEMYLVGTGRINASNAHQVVGCNTTALGGWTNYLARRFATNGTAYNDEFRPTLIIDSIQMTIPSGYQFDSANFYRSASYGNAVYQINNIKPDKVNGSILTFYNNGRFAPLDLNVANAYSGFFQVVVTPKCATQTTEQIVTAIFAKDYVYKFGLDSVYPTAFTGNILGATRNITHLNKGAIRLQNTQLNKRTTHRTEKLSYRISNNSTGNTRFLWGKVPYHTNIRVDSAFLVNPLRKLTLDTLSDGIWFTIDSVGISPGQFRDVELFTQFMACDSDSVKVYGGWDCHEFTTNPNEYACGVDSVWLKMEPDVSEIQLSFEQLKKTSYRICGLDTLALEYNNANASFVYDPYVTLDVPGGFRFPDSAIIEYPAASSNFFKTPIQMVNGRATIPIYAHPLIQQKGIPGLVDATHVNQRNPRILLPFGTDCDFVSGMSLRANAYGFTPCGKEAEGFGFLALSNGIDLEGIAFAGEVKLQVSSHKTRLTCGEPLVVSTKITPYFQKFNPGDTFIYVISSIMKPADSLFKRGNLCTGCGYSVSRNNNNDWVVKITMDTSVAIDTFLEFQLRFVPNGGDTGIAYLEGYFKRNVPPLLCGSFYCENNSVILAKYNPTAIRVALPPSKASFWVETVDSCAKTNAYVLHNTSTTLSSFTSNYSWQFSDQTSSNQAGPVTKNFSRDSTYRIQLMMVNANGCRDTTSQTVVVYPNPQSMIMVNDTGQCELGHVFHANNRSKISDSSALSVFWNINQTDSSRLDSVTHRFASHGTYTVSLAAMSDKGCTDTSYQNLYVYPMPEAGFISNDYDQCLRGNLFAFEATSTISSGDRLSHHWQLGDAVSDTFRQVSHRYDSSGTFTVTLQSTSIYGCVDTFAFDVVVHPMPVSDFAITEPSQCLLGNRFAILNHSYIQDGSPIQYLWDPTPTATPTSDTLFISFADSGTYPVRLTSTSTNGCRDTLEQYLRVNPMPLAVFVANDSSRCLRGNLFEFTNNSLSADGISQHHWSFGDGDTSGVRHPTHSYTSDSLFTVTLEVTSIHQCRDTSEMTVVTHPMPVARFSFDTPLQCQSSNSYTVINQSIIPPPGNGDTYKWYWGNGDSNQSFSPTYRYSTHGDYKVTGIVWTDKQCSDTMIEEVYVKPMPSATFTINDTGQCLRQNSFVFTNTSVIADSSVMNYHWHLGDGTFSTMPHPTHSYPTDSTYEVSLTAISDEGCVAVSMQTVTVYPMPMATYEVSDTALCALGNRFLFQQLSRIAYGNLTFKWDMGDGDTTEGEWVNKTYAQQGIYTPRLVAISDQSCTDTFTGMVDVYPMPVAVFTSEPSLCFRNHLFHFDNQSLIARGRMEALWRGIGLNDTLQSFDAQHRFDSAGIYDVELMMTSDRGCMDTSRSQVVVYDMPVASFLTNDSGQCLLGHQFDFTNTSSIASGERLSYEWESGDGRTVQSLDHVLRYNSSGTYRVRLTVTSDRLCADTFYQSVQVYPMPEASFSVPDSTLCQTESIFDFQNHSRISSGNLVQYEWNMGNGDRFYVFKPVYRYDRLGEYRVQLTAESDQGCFDTAYGTVGVYDNPKAVMAVDSVCLGQPTTFASLSTSIDGQITGYRWEINGVFASDRDAFTRIFNREGSYDVRLMVETVYGCRDTMFEKDMAIVYPNPNADFEVTKIKDSLYTTTYVMTNRSKGNGLQYEWWVSDGQRYGEDNPLIYLNDTGMVSITLKVVDQNGCEDEYQNQFVNYPENTMFIPNAFSPNGDLHNQIFNISGVAYAPQYRMEIYDRWGQKIFETGDLQGGWDGTFQGKPAPPGVYMYKISYLSLQKKFVREKGTVTLLR
jgi:gliding motility-associated-like protein